MDVSQTEDLVSTIHQRSPFLGRINSNTVDRRELHRNIDESRSTVYRALADLEAQQLAIQENGRYEVTPFGRLVYKEYCRFIATLQALCDLENSIRALPPVELFDPIILVDAEVTTVIKGSPNKPLLCLKSLLEDAEFIRLSTPISSWEILQLLSKQLNSDLKIELLQKEPISNEQLAKIRAHDLYKQTAVNIQPPFLLALVEKPEPEVGVMLFDDVGRPEAMIRNTSKAAVDWAESVFRHCVTNR